MRIALIDPTLWALVRKAQEDSIRLLEACAKGHDLRDYIGGTDFSERMFEIYKRSRGKFRYLAHLEECDRAIAKGILENKRPEVLEAASELADVHLPALEEALEVWASKHTTVDRALYEATDHHLSAGRFQDAIRAAFPVLTAKLRQLKRKPLNRDGQKLVNELFGTSGGYFADRWDAEELQALRDLLAGLYGTSRNWHAHNLGRSNALEAFGVIALLHSLLTGPLAKGRRRSKRKKRAEGQGTDNSPTKQ